MQGVAKQGPIGGSRNLGRENNPLADCSQSHREDNHSL